MKKRILAALTAGCLAVSLAGCGGAGSSSAAADTGEAAQTPARRPSCRSALTLPPDIDPAARFRPRLRHAPRGPRPASPDRFIRPVGAFFRRNLQSFPVDFVSKRLASGQKLCYTLTH